MTGETLWGNLKGRHVETSIVAGVRSTQVCDCMPQWWWCREK
jgi:hypothetical protein